MPRTTKRYALDDRVIASLRRRLAELDRSPDPDGSAIHAAHAHRLRCPSRCAVDADGARSEPCALAEALRVVAVYSAHAREPAVLELIQEASKLAGDVRERREQFRKRVAVYARQLVPLHPDRKLIPVGLKKKRAARHHAEAVTPVAIELFMQSAERGVWPDAWGEHDHRACELPFTALASIAALADDLDWFAAEMNDVFESTELARRGGSTGRTPVDLERRLVSILKSARLSDDAIKKLLRINDEQLRNRKSPTRKRG